MFEKLSIGGKPNLVDQAGKYPECVMNDFSFPCWVGLLKSDALPVLFESIINAVVSIEQRHVMGCNKAGAK